MSDENVNVKGVEQVVEKPAPAPYEAKALEMGWRPKEEWDGPEEDFIDAKEYVRRKPLFEKIEHQNKEIKKVVQAFEALKTHHTKVKESEYQRALKTLKDARRQAMVEGETERAIAYEEKIEEVEQQKVEFDRDVRSVNIPQTAEVDPRFIQWQEQNSWYGRDHNLTRFADAIGIDYAKQGMSPSEVLVAVAREVKKEFPNKFTNPNQNRPGAVESPSRKNSPVAKDDVLSPDEERIMKTFVRSGAMTEAAYRAELKRLKGQ